MTRVNIWAKYDSPRPIYIMCELCQLEGTSVTRQIVIKKADCDKIGTHHMAGGESRSAIRPQWPQLQLANHCQWVEVEEEEEEAKEATAPRTPTSPRH